MEKKGMTDKQKAELRVRVGSFSAGEGAGRPASAKGDLRKGGVGVQKMGRGISQQRNPEKSHRPEAQRAASHGMGTQGPDIQRAEAQNRRFSTSPQQPQGRKQAVRPYNNQGGRTVPQSQKEYRDNPTAVQRGFRQRQSSASKQTSFAKRAHRAPAAGHPSTARQLTRVFLSFVAAGMALLMVLLGVSVWMKASTEKLILLPQLVGAKPRDAILVLGCGVYADGTPTPMLQERVNQGIRLYTQGAGKKLLLSGDHGQVTYDEVSAMKKMALEAGVPEEDIFLDHAGFSTWDSLYRAKNIFHAKSLCVVTQRYHLNRALFLGKALDLDVAGSVCDTRTYPNWLWRESREILARVKALFSAWLQPTSEILGEPIDLSGDGRATWGDS